MKQKSILLTFDVEDWFQVENFKQHIKFSDWNSFELRVEKNTHRILDLLDAFPLNLRATFFILGWIAQKLPKLVQEIRARGHEIASHGYDHHLSTNLGHSFLMQDLDKSKKLLEDLIGQQVYGYRAPSFAINDDVFDAIRRAGYKYDSSFNSFSVHGRYGSIDLSNAFYKGSAYQFKSGIFEIPVSNLKIMNRIIPFGGGGYFRLFPFQIFKKGVKQILHTQDAFVFYTHPWEFDPNQPRVNEASKWFRFRHYVNLHKTEQKLNMLIGSFAHCKFITCNKYLSLVD